MCMIVYKPKGENNPREKFLVNSAETNNDGIGIALLKSQRKRIQIKKDFKNVQHLIYWMKKKVDKNDHLIIHFRKATAGEKDFGNRHPFPITTNKKLIRKPNLYCNEVIAHNGVISSFGDDKTLSDTQEFILYVLGRKKIKDNLGDSGIQILIKSLITYDRLLLLNKKGDITLFGKFYKKEGILYSNTGYRDKISYSTKTTYYPRSYYDNYYRKQKNWDNFFNSRKKASEFTSLCDNCNEVKSDVMCVNYKKSDLLLCKDCRRDLSDKKIFLEKRKCKTCNQDFLAHEESEVNCEFCAIEINEPEMVGEK